MSDIGRFLITVELRIITVELCIVVVGVLVTVAGRLPFLGRLPGDILVRRGNGALYAPVMTCLVASSALTIAVNVVGAVPRR